MVYSPTNWEANDVITKDRLNKVEQGVRTATLLSGTDIDTDKDWNGKKISNVAIGTGSSCDIVVALPSDTIRTSIDAQKEFYSLYPTMVKVREITLSPNHRSESAYRVYYDAVGVGDMGVYLIYTQVYVNGTPKGTLHTTNSHLPTTLVDDITGLHPGDKIQVYGASASEGNWHTGFVVNFRLCAYYIACPDPVPPTNTVTL